MQRPALFLDRDGVINVDHGYVHRSEDFEFMPGIFKLVRTANQQGYLVIVVTNQAGIGRGYYSENQFLMLTDWMKGRFKAEGGCIDAVYFCPFHPQHGIGEYRRESECRKPAPGMLLQAQKDFGIDLRASILIGDKPSDISAGSTAGVGKLLHLSRSTELEDSRVDTIYQVDEALSYIVESTK